MRVDKLQDMDQFPAPTGPDTWVKKEDIDLAIAIGYAAGYRHCINERNLTPAPLVLGPVHEKDIDHAYRRALEEAKVQSYNMISWLHEIETGYDITPNRTGLEDHLIRVDLQAGETSEDSTESRDL